MRPLLRLLLSLTLLAAGCAEPNDRPSQIESLRVLAVRTDQPFAAPASSVDLEMLLVDGSPAAPRPVQVLWLGTCLNPPGDLYYECYPVLHATVETIGNAALAAEQPPPGAPSGTVGFGTRFTAQIPADAITSRTQAQGVVSPYGVLFVFFAACAGELRLGDDLPVACVQPGTGEPLGQADFEFGYYPVYVYDELKNQVPVIGPLAFGAPSSPTPCAAPADCGAGQVCGSKGVCIPAVAACSAADADDCPGYALAPAVDASSAEPAASSHIAASVAPLETIWMSYYATGGVFDKDSRIVHDAISGWADTWEGAWRPHLGGGREVRLFAVVRDNRGGVAWLEQDVAVR